MPWVISCCSRGRFPYDNRFRDSLGTHSWSAWRIPSPDESRRDPSCDLYASALVQKSSHLLSYGPQLSPLAKASHICYSCQYH